MRILIILKAEHGRQIRQELFLFLVALYHVKDLLVDNFLEFFSFGIRLVRLRKYKNENQYCNFATSFISCYN
jgi:hypothetical protein